MDIRWSGVCILVVMLTACSGGHQQNQEKIRKQNAHAEYIRRRAHEKLYPEPSLELVQRESYPWEKEEKYTQSGSKNSKRD